MTGSRQPAPRLVLSLILAAATLLVFWPVHTYEFTNYDDDVYVTDNSHVRHGLTYDGAAWAVTSLQVNWHPLTWLSHMLDCQLYGLSAGAHHMSNVLLHVANSVLLFLILQRMTGAAWQSAFVAALFAVHPLHVESVAWIAERKDVLSTLFWMLTLWAYVWYTERPSVGRYTLVALALSLGLLSKPMLVTVPGVLLLLDYWPLRRFAFSPLLGETVDKREPHPSRRSRRKGPPQGERKLSFETNNRPARPEELPFSGGVSKGARWRESTLPTKEGELAIDPRRKEPIHRPNVSAPSWSSLLWEKLPLLVLAAGASVITIVAQRQMRAVGALELLPLSERIENALVAYATYLVKAIWPAGLAVFYPHPRHTLPLWQPLGAALMLVAVSLAVIRLARRHPYLAVGWLWYLGTLVPVIGVVQVGRQAMADRYTYVPLIGIFIMVAWGVPELLAGWRWRRVALRTAAAASLAALTACTWLQLRHWKNSVTLFERALAVTVNNAVAHGNLGQALAQDGRLGDAIVEYEAAVRIAPDDATTQRNLGAALDQQGKTAEAAPHLSAALRLDPRDARAHDDLGIVLTRLGRYDEATQEYSTALRLAPDSAKAHNNFADLLLRQGKFADAVEHCTAALRLKPDYAEAHNTLGVALARQGKVADAAAHFSAAVRLRSDYPEARRNLALALEEQRQR